MTATEQKTLGYSCDDYHRLIAQRVVEHSEKLGRLVDYVEIGTFTGNSAEAVLATCKVRHAVLIDDFSLRFEGQKQSKEMVEARLAKYDGLFEVMEGDSRKVARNITETFDVGFVDGDHEEDSCRIDMTNMFRLIRHDGVMFVHDVGNQSFTYLMPVVGAFVRDNNLVMSLHNVSDGLAELRR
jgi:hypothetical protein